EARPFRGKAAEEDDEEDCGEANAEGGEAYAVPALPERRELVQEIRRQMIDLKAEEVLQLAGGDDEGDAEGEAVDHRFRDELDEVSEPQGAGGQQDEPGHQRGEDEAVIAMGGDDTVNDDDESAGGPADLHPAA